MNKTKGMLVAILLSILLSSLLMAADDSDDSLTASISNPKMVLYKDITSGKTLEFQNSVIVNNENDYGGNINNAPNVHYYHLWFTKNEYLIHITSKGSNEAEGFITKIAQQILSKFG